MRKPRLQKFVGIATAATLAVGTTGACDRLAEVLAPTQSTTGQITFWTSDPAPSPIAVEVDGTVVGTLTRYSTAPPTCGAATTGGALTVTVPAGSSLVSAFETDDTGRWAPDAVSVSGGGCTLYEFQP